MGRFGILVAALCQAWGWAVDCWLMWAGVLFVGFTVCTDLSFSAAAWGSSVCQTLGSDPGTCVAVSCNPRLGLVTLSFPAPQG